MTSYVTKYDENTSTSVDIPFSIKKVSAYGGSIMFLTREGRVFALGTNVNCCMGGEGDDITTPKELKISNVIDVATSDNKTLLVTKDNVLYGCGGNDYTALGLQGKGSVIRTLTVVPSRVYNNEKILFVAPAYSFSIVVTEESNMFLLGQNWCNPNNSDTNESVCFNIQKVTEKGKIVALQCGSFHVGILNSAGEVFLGGDPDTGKLGKATEKYYGMKKLKSEHVFSSMAIFGDSTVLGSLDGTLLAYGGVTGYNTTANKFETKYPPIVNVSGQGRDITICTADGQVFVHNEDEGTRVEKGNYDTRYNVLSATTTYHTFVCLASKKNEVLSHLQLLTKTIHRDEFKDIIFVQ